MQTKRLNVVIILVLFFVPLATLLIMSQLNPVCTWYFAPHCAPPPVWLFGLVSHWVGSGILRISLLPLVAYAGMLIVRTKIPSFPHRIVLAFAIVLIPLGSEISDYVPFGFCAMGTVPRCLFLTRWLQQAVLDWYGHGPLVLSLIMLAVYGLVLRVGVWVSRTDTAASTYVPTVDTDA
ncbi:MAG: hypothetical protein GFH23_1086674n71 [Chloroflexi bacterium AL-N1]|nr:hypothetical protein [Chloroflexi bacterium AL-N1]NOK92208.1 hypothetical protein [Chloroflexi bacterium AL-N15]